MRALPANEWQASEDLVRETVRAAGIAVFPGWELYAPVAGANESFFDLLPSATVVLDEPDSLTEAHDAWWTKVTETHERSLIGNLVRPEDLYLSPEAMARAPRNRCRPLRSSNSASKAATTANISPCRPSPLRAFMAPSPR